MRHEVTGDRHVRRLHLLALQAEPGRIAALELAAIKEVHADRRRRRRGFALRTKRRGNQGEHQDRREGAEDLVRRSSCHSRASYTGGSLLATRGLLLATCGLLVAARYSLLAAR